MAYNVLIVDDSRMSRMLIGAIVEDVFPDAEIIEADDGETALQKSDSLTIDIATIDLNMPGMNGLELSEQLKQRSPNVHIGLMTSTTDDDVQLRASGLGLHFVPKPITEEAVEAFLRSVSE